MNKSEMIYRILKTSKGVTLIELMVTICIVAILATTGASLMMDFRALHQLNGATMEVLIGMQKARSVALKNNRNVVVEFDKDKGSYSAFIDDGGGDITKAGNMTKESGEMSIFGGIVPGFVTISNVNFSTAKKFTYTNKGFPKNIGGNATTGTIELTNPSTGDKRQIDLYITGHAQIQ